MSCSSSSLASSCSQNFYYVGINLQGILYGIEIVLYLRTMRVFLGRRPLQRNDLFYVAFSTVVFFLVTVSVATAMLYGQKMWLLNPGASDTYEDNYLFFGSGGIVILQQMIDGLMIYRSYVLWNSYRAIVIPCILWLATFVLGILVCLATEIPGNHVIFGVDSQFWLVYYALAVILNLTSTCLICFRLVMYARTVKKHLGAKHASLYFNIIILVVESALPFTLSGVALVISSGVGSPVAVVFSRVYILMMSISPQMLILRAAEGKAWRIESFEPPDFVMRFAPGPSSRTDSVEMMRHCPPDSRGPGSISLSERELDASDGITEMLV